MIRIAGYFPANTNGPAGLPDWVQVKPSLFPIFSEDYFNISVDKPQRRSLVVCWAKYCERFKC